MMIYVHLQYGFRETRSWFSDQPTPPISLYFQHGAPATEISGYADGVAISDQPLGNFVHQSLPLSWKPGGFARGSGHGATFQDKWENYWHISTISISVKNSFERRLGLCPAGFDNNDIVYCNTAFG